MCGFFNLFHFFLIYQQLLRLLVKNIKCQITFSVHVLRKLECFLIWLL